LLADRRRHLCTGVEFPHGSNLAFVPAGPNPTSRPDKTHVSAVQNPRLSGTEPASQRYKSLVSADGVEDDVARAARFGSRVTEVVRVVQRGRRPLEPFGRIGVHGEQW